MAKKRRTILDRCRAHSRTLPKFSDEASASRALLGLVLARRDRLAGLAGRGGAGAADYSPQSLESIERWIGGVSEQGAGTLGTSLSELEFLLRWYAAAVAVRHARHAVWVVQEDSFVRGRWSLAVRQGLATYILPNRPCEPRPRQSRRRFPHLESDWLRQLVERVDRDPTLHPAVLANTHRLSDIPGVADCQMAVLRQGVDAFDELAVRGALSVAKPSRQLELIRCLEPMPSLGDETVSLLSAIARAPHGPFQFATALVITQRAAAGTRLADELRPRLMAYAYPPVVRAIDAIPDLAATRVLSDAVEKISRSKQSLWQHGEAFALALRGLWRSAKAGDSVAQAALRVAGRRWMRIDRGTLRLMRRLAPGLTRTIAIGGGRRVRTPARRPGS